MNQSAISNETQSGQLQRDIETLRTWTQGGTDRVDGQCRQALENVINHPQITQLLQQGQSQTRSASAASGGMGYGGANRT